MSYLPNTGLVTLGGDVTGASNANLVSAISGSSPILITPPTFSWLSTVSGPKINQVDNTTASTTGQNLTIQAQNATGTTSTGGILVLKSGTGTTAPGFVQLSAGSTVVEQLGQSTTDFIALGPIPATTGTIRLSNASTVLIRNNANSGDISIISKDTSDNVSFGSATSQLTNVVSNNGINLIAGGVNIGNITTAETVWAVNTVSVFSGQTNPVIRFQPISTASATGGSLTIRGQNSTGTTSTGGDLILTSGTGTTTSGITHIQAGGTDIAKVDINKFYALKGYSNNVTNVTAAYTILKTDYIVAVGAIAAGITVTLPLSPVQGDTYEVVDAAGTASTKNITVSGNGINIAGAATYVMNINYSGLLVAYNSVTNAWMII